MKNIITTFLLATTFFCNQTTKATYYSQCEQDAYIHQNFFPNKTDGVYLEIGAHNGISLSNTYFFEQLGWRGMCVEPINEEYENLRKNRNEKCICIKGAISNFNGPAKFLYIKGVSDMLSGLIHHYDPRHVKRIKIEAGIYNKNEFIERTVECFKISDLLEKHNMFHIDYLSIDTEGGELEILKTIDYTKFDIDVITIEDNYGYPEIKTFLASQGFVFIAKLRHDLLFRNQKYCN